MLMTGQLCLMDIKSDRTPQIDANHICLNNPDQDQGENRIAHISHHYLRHKLSEHALRGINISACRLRNLIGSKTGATLYFAPKANGACQVRLDEKRTVNLANNHGVFIVNHTQESLTIALPGNVSLEFADEYSNGLLIVSSIPESMTSTKSGTPLKSILSFEAFDNLDLRIQEIHTISPDQSAIELAPLVS